MDTSQALPPSDVLPTLVPFSQQIVVGKDLQNAEFSKVFREASVRTTNTDALPEALTGDAVPVIIQSSVSPVGKLPPGGNLPPPLGQGIATPVDSSPEATTTQPMLFAMNAKSNDTLDATGNPLTLSQEATTVMLSRAIPTPSNHVPPVTESSLNLETTALLSNNSPQKTPGAQGQVAELPNVASFRADSMRIDAPRPDARRAQGDVNGVSNRISATKTTNSINNNENPSLSVLSSVLSVTPQSSAVSTTQMPPATLVMQPGAPLLDSLGEKIIWLTRQDNQQATLQLRPAELGALEIRVSISNATSTQIEIHAQQADTGELIESMLPRLQQALEQQGLKLDDVRMSQLSLFSDARSSQQQPSSREHSPHAAAADGHADGGEENGDDILMTTLNNESAIDTYA